MITEADFLQVVEGAVDDLLHPKPYLVCCCHDFIPGERDVLHYRVQCRRCDGWVGFKEYCKCLEEAESDD